MTTLLAVDDSNTMRKVLEITFAGEDDLEVVLATGANDALGRLNEHRPSLALIDVTLPDTDGYALCELVKRQAPDTRVLLLSSKQNPYDPSRGSSCGADDHVDKPFDTQALLDRVRTLLESAPIAAVNQAAPTPIVQAYQDSSPPQLQLEPESVEPGYLDPAQQFAPEPQYSSEPQHASEPPYSPDPQYVEPPPEPVVAAPEPADFVPQPITNQPGAAEAAVLAAATIRPNDVNGSSSTNGFNGLGDRLAQLGLTQDQVQGVLALSREVIEQAVWEVVPALAETLIKEEIARLTNE